MLNRDRVRDHLTLMDDYFAPDVLFADNFCQRFWMGKNVFDHLYHGIRSFEDYFIFKNHDVGRIGFSGYQKCTAALRMLAYGTTAGSWDEYLWMSESTCGDDMVRFTTAVFEVIGPQYLREPTAGGIERLLAILEARGWPAFIIVCEAFLRIPPFGLWLKVFNVKLK
ncbi:uncharacterized protein [Aegilops tauschii subsp. strangulata]|uniref:uncharacterized protein n=1 Tax=Aegilops tauschii subsp. strangulata TaxID=200361 RepID=UPI00098A9F79|nr:uncharacterized protein LOC109749897 [Aegilops tauschii subsp. strangulata]